MENKEKQELIKKIAEAHVDWFLEMIRPLLISEFVHGYKHGLKDKEKK